MSLTTPETVADSLIALEGVTVKLGGARDGELLLDEVDLTIERGDIALVAGDTGAGKSTLFRLMTAAEQPHSGSVSLFGRDLRRLRQGSLVRLRRLCGIIAQDSLYLEDATVLDNAALPLRLRHHTRRYREEVALEALAYVGLADRKHHKPRDLSGGERRRLSWARALSTGPELLIADEPTADVDLEGLKLFIGLVERLSATGTTCLVTSGDLRLAEMARIYRWRRWLLANGMLESHVTEAVSQESGRVSSLAEGAEGELPDIELVGFDDDTNPDLELPENIVQFPMTGTDAAWVE